MNEMTTNSQSKHVKVGTVKIDSLGRLVIPKDIRMDTGLLCDTLVDVTFDGKTIVLQKSYVYDSVTNKLDELQGQIELLGKGGDYDKAAATELLPHLEAMRRIVEDAAN